MVSEFFRNWAACACALAGFAIGLPAQAQPTPPTPPEVHIYQSGPSGGSFLGVGVKEIDADRARALKLKEEAGVEITRVEDDSPAAKAGLKVGDAVLQFNGERVEGMEQFSRMVRETPPGREVKLTISRNGSLQTIVAKLGMRKGMTFGPQTFEIPRLEIPPMPDIPRNIMSWRSPALGIEAEPLRGQLADFFGVKEGVLVRSVLKDSAAERAGLKAGDVIVKVNDARVTSPSEISSQLRSVQEKKNVALLVMREHRELTLTANIDNDEDMRGPRAPRARAIKM